MDYTIQTEKIFKFLEFNTELHEARAILKLKKIFNNDLNLIGGFIKDYLTLELDGNIPSDDNLYNDFVICFENNKNKTSFIKKLINYANYYITLIFEETNDRVLLNTIVSVNSCYKIEYYPFLMEIMDKFLNKKIDSISYALMLQLITDDVFKNFESETQKDISLIELRKQLESILHSKNERIAI
ncbi:MAG: hypothetical protein IJB79_00300 [Candidatus Gastranaerophilales bacterium]|nr:hypothetical protein [Candidatus Gastranaerophilales bacterium]